LGILRDRRSICDLGRDYRSSHPEENDADRLLGLISANPPVSEPALRTALNRQQQREFARHQTVVLRGWVLSRTEARQCALYSLLYA